MQIVLENTGNFKVSFKYNPTLVNFIRQVPGREFDPKQKVWKVPGSSKPDLIKVAENVQNFQRVVWKKEEEIDPRSDKYFIPPMPELTVPHGLKYEPKPYQAQGIARGLELKRYFNGDDPGLGKTFETIGTVNIAHNLYRSSIPALVACPGSVKYHWQREWSKFTDLKALVLTDELLDSWPYYVNSGLFHVIIVSFGSLQKYFVQTIRTAKGKPMLFQDIVFKPTIDLFKTVIIDESHRCKELTAQQTKFAIGIANGIAKKKEWKINLSGTPVVNLPKDLKAQLMIIDRLNDFGGSRYFDQRYCSGINKASNLRELNAKLWQTCFFRRTKNEVRKDLPPVTRQIISCDISNKKEYTLAQKDFINYLKLYKEEKDSKKQRSMRHVARQKMNVLSTIAAKGKIKSIVEHVRDFQKSGKKLLIYAENHVVVDMLLKYFPKAVCITGRQTPEEKQFAVDSFSRNPKVTLAIMSEAGGTGTDGLQNQCSEIDLIQHPWHDAGLKQVISRVDRGGQKEPVNARIWQAINTVDEKKWKIVETKKNIADSVTGDADIVQEDIVDMMVEMFNDEIEG